MRNRVRDFSSFGPQMLLSIFLTSQRCSCFIHSLHKSTRLPKPTPLSILHFHTAQQPEDVSNFYTHLLQSHPHPRSISQVHARILTQGSSSNSFIATHIVKSYAKAGNIQSARFVFESAKNKRVFLWNAMIRACSRDELWEEIVDLYRRMEGEGVEPDHYTLPFVIKAFGLLRFVEEGRRAHDLVRRIGLVRNLYVATALMEMYIELAEIDLALQVFKEMPHRDVVAWTSIISGYVSHGIHSEAISMFRDMRLGDDKPNWVTVLSLIPACDYSIHSFIVKSGFDLFVEVETAVLNMYAKSGDVAVANGLFNQMSEKNLVSWTVMVSGYSQNGYANEALYVFYQMLKTAEHKPDVAITASVVQACSQLGSLNYGEVIHGYIVRIGTMAELPVETALVDMYAKCGSLTAAKSVFDGIRDRNIIAWSALIAGYGCHGFGSKALDLFEEMKRDGFVPDETAFLGVLSACSHSGLVTEGKKFFDSMCYTYKLTPRTKHYTCMVDLLGRAGLLDEAVDLIRAMPIEPDMNIWGALLSACKIKGNVELAEYAYKRLMDLSSDSTNFHVLIANIYAESGRWDEASKLRHIIKRKGEKKTPGCSYIEVNCKIHEFFAGVRLLTDFKNISSTLEVLHTLASEEVQNFYVPSMLCSKDKPLIEMTQGSTQIDTMRLWSPSLKFQCRTHQRKSSLLLI